MYMKDLRFVLLLDCYGKMLTSHQKKLMSLYYEDDLSLGELAESLGISRQAVRDSLKRAESTLLACEEKIHMEQKYTKLKNILSNIKKLSENLPDSSEKEQILKLAKDADEILN